MLLRDGNTRFFLVQSHHWRAAMNTKWATIAMFVVLVVLFVWMNYETCVQKVQTLRARLVGGAGAGADPGAA